ncbi:MAG: response regulator transcription factor [Planctomycetes bacterium]|nr:response regulator transcription factor [Planctomycetota bacterium]
MPGVVKSATDRLFLSVKTIESYRSRLMAKRGLTNRAKLTQVALDAGLMDGTAGG